MGKGKKTEPFDLHNLNPQDQLKFEIAQELGLDSKVLEGGWKSLTAKESGRIAGVWKFKNQSITSNRCGHWILFVNSFYFLHAVSCCIAKNVVYY